ncbi:hypothetical protein AB4Z19_28055 [Pseudoduganella sp. RAF19]|uniref:hypothetical protein n=1 Tax=Pseudoduganella sp. RAF19 TaxID=3233052 RepID=UPI003F99F4AD
MQVFIENNWLSILSIVIGIVVSYVFYRLQKKDSASASAERKKHAATELLDVIESYIINKQQLSEHVIDNLIHASERGHLVALRPEFTAISLLQDVALRLQRSRHLDIPQKSEYSVKIDHLIREIRERREPFRLEDLDEELSAKLQELQQFLPAEKTAEAQAVLLTVASLIQKLRETTIRTEESKERLLAVTTPLLGVAAALATSLIGSRVFDSVSDSSASSMAMKMFPILGIALAAVVTMTAVSTAIRIKRRSRNHRSRVSKAEI